MVAVLATTKPDMALVLLTPPSDNEKRKIIQGVIYIPQNFSRQITATEVGAHMCSVIANGNHRPPKGKYANNSNIEIVTFSGEDSLQLIRAVHAGKTGEDNQKRTEQERTTRNEQNRRGRPETNRTEEDNQKRTEQERTTRNEQNRRGRPETNRTGEDDQKRTEQERTTRNEQNRRGQPETNRTAEDDQKRIESTGRHFDNC
ncbi:hypothetical protein LSAT2_021247 [Lamellibrachia satsuma]|nr:hypothetical protein LSAT2_021247 [Lamellibrachia satsuma]